MKNNDDRNSKKKIIQMSKINAPFVTHNDRKNRHERIRISFVLIE